MLKGKVMVVTGASSGIGAAVAKLLGKESATVIIAARRLNLLEQVAGQSREAGGTCIVHQCDVSRREDAENLIHSTARQFGRLDVLINNAGRGHFSSVEDTTDAVLHSMFDVNVFSLWYTTRPALQYMKSQGSGHIINIASMAGKIGYPYNSAYVAAKHACVGFTLALRQELLETGIHATVVCPASVATEWANVTEGGSMRSMFSESGKHIKRIAAERRISLPEIEGLKSAEEVAASIVDCIHHPVAEVFTHQGSKEFVLSATENREVAEHRLLPIVLGEREAYERLRGT